MCTDFFPKQPCMYKFVFLMGKQVVCCEVRTGTLDVIQMNFMFEKRAVPQAVSRWSATIEDRVRFRAKPCEFWGGRSGTGTEFSPSISVFLVYWYSLLIVVLTSLLPEGQAVQPGGDWVKLPLFRILGSTGQKIAFTLFILERVNLAYGEKNFANWFNLYYLLIRRRKL